MKIYLKSNSKLLLKIFLFISLFFLTAFAAEVKASCTYTEPELVCTKQPMPRDTCEPNDRGGSKGTVYYKWEPNYCACGPEEGEYDREGPPCNEPPKDSGPGYYKHSYDCDEPCGGGVTPPPTPTSGGGGCSSSNHHMYIYFDQNNNGILEEGIDPVVDNNLCSSLDPEIDISGISWLRQGDFWKNHPSECDPVREGSRRLPKVVDAVPDRSGAGATYYLNLPSDYEYVNLVSSRCTQIAANTFSCSWPCGNSASKFLIREAPPVVPSCKVNVQSPFIVQVGQTVFVPFSVREENNGTIDQVTFTLNNDNLSVCSRESPMCSSGNQSYVDESPGFGAKVTAFNPGNATISVSAVMLDEGGISCQGDPNLQANINIPNVLPWWQVNAGNIMVKQDDISSNVYSCDPNLSTCVELLDINDENPGIPLYPDSISPSSPSLISSEGWKVRTSFLDVTPRKGYAFDYNFFLNKLRPPIYNLGVSSITNLSQITPLEAKYEGGNYFVLRKQGDLTISQNINLGTNKVILLVDGNLNINAKINLTRGQGFFMAIAKRYIYINSNVGDAPIDVSAITSTDYDLEGIYVANKQIGTGGGDKQLLVRGVFAAMGYDNYAPDNIGEENSLLLQRNLVNNVTHPAEYFEYAPDLIFNYPSFMGEKSIIWTEQSP